MASLRLAALSLALSHGRGDKVVAARSVSGFGKRWGLINIDFAYPLQHFLLSAPSPAEEGWGEGLAELKQLIFSQPSHPKPAVFPPTHHLFAAKSGDSKTATP